MTACKGAVSWEKKGREVEFKLSAGQGCGGQNEVNKKCLVLVLLKDIVEYSDNAT